MTLISSEAAILFGGTGTGNWYGVTGNCWILNTAKLLSCEFDTPSSLWKHCSHHDNERWTHAAVLEPISKRLWILGGIGGTGILSMSFNSAAPLRLLAMESVIRHFDRGHEAWKATEILGDRTELENRRAHMKEEVRSGIVGQSSTK